MDGITGFLKSKKGIGTILGMVLNLLVATGLVLLADDVEKKEVIAGLTTLIGCFVVGQGVADHGKEKAKVEAAAATPSSGGDGGE